MYRYKDQRPFVFTKLGQVTFLKVRDEVKRMLEESRAFTMGAILAARDITGDNWDVMACVDRLVELDEIREFRPSSTRGPASGLVRVGG